MVCPSVFEKEGSFVNISSGFPEICFCRSGQAGIRSDRAVLERILVALKGEGSPSTTMDDLWQQISSSVEAFSGITWKAIGSQGLAVNPGRSGELNYIETKNLKYDPIAFKESQVTLAELK